MQTATTSRGPRTARFAAVAMLALLVLMVGLAGVAGWSRSGDTLLWSMMQAGLAWCL